MFKFTCMRCRECCYFTNEKLGPLLFEFEVLKIKELAKKLGIDNKFQFEEVLLGNVKMYRWLISGYCPFLDINNRKCFVIDFITW